MSNKQAIKTANKSNLDSIIVLDSVKIRKRKFNKKPVLVSEEENVIVSKIPPYLANEIKDHKEDCNCDSCMVVKCCQECLESDKIQVEEDNEEARKKGYVENEEGDWIKLNIEKTEITDSTDGESSSDKKPNSRVKMSDEERKAKKREYYNKYYSENKEKILPKKKEWQKNNKDKINTEAKREYQKKYDAEHKEQIKARRAERVQCFCGFLEQLTKSSMDKHLKSDRHRILLELKQAKDLLSKIHLK